MKRETRIVQFFSLILLGYLIAFFLVGPAWGASVTCYVSPTGSNTSPYETPAKAANLPSTCRTYTASVAPTGTLLGQGHNIYIAPGTYSDYLLLNNANDYGLSVIGVSDLTTLTAASKGQVKITPGANVGINITRHDITVKNIELTGNSGNNALIELAGANFFGDHLYLHDSTFWLFKSGTGGNDFTLQYSTIQGCNVNEGVAFYGDSSGIVKYSIISNSDTKPLITTSGGAGIMHNGTGTVNLYNNEISGSNYVAVRLNAAGTLNVYNNIIWGSIYRLNYTLMHATGTLNYGNNIIMQNWAPGSVTSYVHRNISGTPTDAGGNLTTSYPKLTRSSRNGYIIIASDDGEYYSYVADMETLLNTYGYKMSWAVNAGDVERNATLRTNVQGLANRGVVEIVIHGYSHSDPTLTGNTFSITKAAHTINVNRTTDQIIIDGAAPVTVTGFKAKSLKTIRTELAAGGCTLGSMATNLEDYTLGESLADSAGGQASPYTPQLKINGNTDGYLYVETTYAKAVMEAQLTGYTAKSFGTPNGSMSSGVATAIQTAGFRSARTHEENTTSPLISSIDLMYVPISMIGTDMKGLTDAATQNNIRSLCETLSQYGGVMVLLAHTASEFSIADWTLALDIIKNEYQQIQVVSQSQFADIVKDSGTWTTADNRTYTRTWTDLSDYRLRASSPANKTGIAIAGIHDQAGCLTFDGKSCYTATPNMGAESTSTSGKTSIPTFPYAGEIDVIGGNP